MLFFLAPYRLARIRVTLINKKRGSLYLSLVPLLEAFALPNLNRTSNAEAHADMKYMFQPRISYHSAQAHARAK